MQKIKTNILQSGIALAVAVVVFTGCLKSSDNTTPPSPKSYLSILHLAPTAPPVDVFFNDTKVSNSSFVPGYVTPLYNPVDKGVFSIKFKKASLDSLVAQVPSLQYDSLNFYTVFIYNQQANGPAIAIRIKDDFSDIQFNSDKPFYRFFHASPNTGATDLYIDNVKVESGRMQADNAINQTFNKFLATTSGSHTIQTRLAGTDSVIATLNFVDLLAGSAYTFYLKGLEGVTGLNELSLGVLRAAN